MSHMANSPLPALVDYYDRLQADSSQAVPLFGYSRQKISFIAVIERDGSLHSIQDARVEDGGRLIPASVTVPGQSKPPGRGINPCLLWERGRYLLGFRPNDENDEERRRTADCFAAFRDRHLGCESDIQDDDFTAVCRFLERWDAKDASQHATLAELGAGFGVFKVRPDLGYVHQRAKVREYWDREVVAGTGEDGAVAVSLVSGRTEPIARLHEPRIKGVRNAQTSGAVLVGFNDSAYESYGKTQSHNGPVGVRDAFRYANALNHLLADRARRIQVGDTTVVFWAGRSSAKDAEELFAALFAEGAPTVADGAESGKTVDRVRAFLAAARQGTVTDQVSDADAAFYVLGLSPNGSRLYVRFWLAATVKQLADRLARHVADLEIAGAPAGAPLLVLRGIAEETVPPKNGWPDRDRVPPKLAGDLARAVLLGLSYPAALLQAVVARIRAEGFVTGDKNARNFRADWKLAGHHRAAILKAVLIRNHKLEVPMALDPQYGDEAYHLGRLFAALEKTQEDSAGRDLGSTIKDRYFGAASASPANVFPTLMKLHQHHMNKIDNVGQRVNREKLVTDICSRLTRFPAHLPLAKQGLFYIGYYHQRQAFFLRKDEATKEVVNV